jgi:tetratricopeptide (TPR) repeat protein
LSQYTFSDSLAIGLKDSVVSCMVNNRIALFYRVQGKYDLAEAYLLKSIEYSKIDIIPNYITLSNIYGLQGKIDKSRELLHEILKSEDSPEAKGGIIYQQYLLEKEAKDWKRALQYYEESMDYVDSIRSAQSKTDLLEIEKKYTTEKIRNENNLLRLKSQRYFLS